MIIALSDYLLIIDLVAFPKKITVQEQKNEENIQHSSFRDANQQLDLFPRQ